MTTSTAGAALKIFSVNGVKEVLSRLGDAFHAETGEQAAFTFGTIGALQNKIAAGDVPDVLVAMSSAMSKAEEQGLIARGGSVEVGRTGLGAVVRQGAPTPDISSAAAFRDVLLAATSLAYTDPGTGAASGVAVAAIIAQLGIGDRLKDKTILVGGGSVGDVVARGEAEFGLQQVTELLPVKGITLLAGFPADLQRVTVYQAGALRHSAKADAAAAVVRVLASPRVQQRFADAGFGRY